MTGAEGEDCFLAEGAGRKAEKRPDPYKDVKPDSPEGEMVAKMEDFRKEIMGIYTSALVDAGENFRENGIYINGDGAKYSIREIIGESGKNYGKGVYLDSTILDKLSDAERINAVKGFIRKIGGSSFTAYDKNGIARDIIIAESRSRFRNAKGKSVQVNNHMTSFLNNPVKQEALVLVDEMITTSVFDGKEKANHAHDWLDNNGMNEWDVWKVYLQEKNKTVWEAILRVANTTNGEKILYEVYPINMVEAARKPGTSTTGDTLTQPDSVVKQKNSDRDPTAEATRAALEKENGKLREDVSRLRELLSLQGKVTGGTVPKQSSVEAAAKYLNKYAGAKADVKELSGMLTDFYKFLATDKYYSWEDVQQRAMVIARYLQDNVQIKPQLSDYARDVIRAVRGINITLDKSQRAEKAKIDALAKAYEDIKNSSDPALQDAYSDAVSQYLFTLEANVGDTRLGDMTLDQIGDFYFFTITYSLFTKSYRRFLKVIRNSE